jgi:hypothetical protein
MSETLSRVKNQLGITQMSNGSFSGRTKTDSNRRSQDRVLTTEFEEHHKKAGSIATKNLSDFQLTETSYTNLKLND